MPNEILVVFSEPPGYTLFLGDRVEFVDLALDAPVHVRNLSQRNAFTVYIQANNVHDLRLPMSHGSS